jgi:hypothetical protein
MINATARNVGGQARRKYEPGSTEVIAIGTGKTGVTAAWAVTFVFLLIDIIHCS